MAEDNLKFEYTYSATRQDEIDAIRKKYLPKEEDKMETLRRLDRNVTRKGSTAALTLGTMGTFLLGIGMCCTIMWAKTVFFPGILMGSIGILFIACAYPMFKKVAHKEKEKIAPRILALSEELLK